MSAARIPSTTSSRSRVKGPDRSTSPKLLRPILLGLAAIVALAGTGVGIALITGATLVFNILVFALFTVLWFAIAAGPVFSPRTLDDAWSTVCALPVVVQGIVWLLFLPIMIGLWIWQRVWPSPTRVSLVVVIAAGNIFMFFPR